MGEALAIARSYLGRANIEVASADGAVVELALALMDRHHLGRKRMADALLAAAMIAHGVDDLITCNTRDFELFDELPVMDPTA